MATPFKLKKGFRRNGPPGLTTVREPIGGQFLHRFGDVVTHANGFSASSCTVETTTVTSPSGLPCVKITSSTNGTCSFKFFIDTIDISSPGLFQMQYYTPDVTAANNWQFGFSSSNFTNNIKLQTVAKANATANLWAGWHTMRFGIAEMDYNGATDITKINSFQVEILTSVSGSVYYFAAPMYGVLSKPGHVQLTFDDNRTSLYTVALDAVEARGRKLTSFILGSRLGQATYMTLAETQDLVARGHGVAIHNYADIDWSEASTGDGGAADMDLIKAYMTNNGLISDAYSLKAAAYNLGGSPDDTEQLTVTNATNAAPIVITTSAAHGLPTGTSVVIASVGGNTAANGTWTITNVSSTTFSLNGSTGNGAYTSGGTATHNYYGALELAAMSARGIIYGFNEVSALYSNYETYRDIPHMIARKNLEDSSYHGPAAAPVATRAATPGNVDNGVHKYAVTFLTAAGLETEPINLASATIADKTVEGQVELTVIPTGVGGTGRITKRNVYRTAAGAGKLLLLTTLADNTTTTYTDNKADASLVQAETVSAASNASPIVITTSAAHGLVSNQVVTIASVGGNTAANGTWEIVVASSTTFALAGSSGNGAYTSGGTVAVNAPRFSSFPVSKAMRLAVKTGGIAQINGHVISDTPGSVIISNGNFTALLDELDRYKIVTKTVGESLAEFEEFGTTTFDIEPVMLDSSIPAGSRGYTFLDIPASVRGLGINTEDLTKIFTDTAGTTAATDGQAIQRINNPWGISDYNLYSSTDDGGVNRAPLLQVGMTNNGKTFNAIEFADVNDAMWYATNAAPGTKASMPAALRTGIVDYTFVTAIMMTNLDAGVARYLYDTRSGDTATGSIFLRNTTNVFTLNNANSNSNARNLTANTWAVVAASFNSSSSNQGGIIWVNGAASIGGAGFGTNAQTRFLLGQRWNMASGIASAGSVYLAMPMFVPTHLWRAGMLEGITKYIADIVGVTLPNYS